VADKANVKTNKAAIIKIKEERAADFTKHHIVHTAQNPRPTIQKAPQKRGLASIYRGQRLGSCGLRFCDLFLDFQRGW
jgi:hypothetical protein